MKDPEHDELWALLGRARESAPSPFFSAKVVASIRDTRQRHRLLWLNWFRFGIPGALAGAIALFMAMTSLMTHRPQPEQPRMIVTTHPEPSDVEVIADLDYNLASEESSTWLDSSAH